MKDKLARNPLPVVFFTVFVDLLGFGILIPVIPQLLANPASSYFLLPSGINSQQGYIILGFLTAIFPLMQFLAAPILGQLSDKVGRRKVLAFSLAGTCFSYILFAIGIITRNIPLLFISRAADGITGGNIAVAQAAIADVSTPQNRAKSFGLIGAAFGLGFILGPFIGGKLSDPTLVSWFNAATPFWFAAAISFLNVLSVLMFFPETLKVKQSALTINWSKSVENIKRAISYKDLRTILSVVFLFQAGFTFFTTFFGVFMIKRLGYNQGNIGDFFAYIGLWIAFTQAVVVRRLSSRIDEVRLLKFTIILTGVMILCYYLTYMPWQLFLIGPFFAIFNGLSQVHTTGLVSRSVSAEVQGEILGINASVAALAQTIPPIISGFIAANIVAEAPILVASSVIIVSGIIYVLFYKPAFHHIEE